MGVKVSVGDMQVDSASLRPVMIFPFRFAIDEDNPALIAVLIKMLTWAEYFPGFLVVSENVKIGNFSLDSPHDFEFEIPFETIRKLDNTKKQNDMGFEFRVSAVYNFNDRVSVGQGVYINVKSTRVGTDTVDKRVPHSDWVRFLNSCGYSELEQFHMHYTVRRELDEFRKLLGDPKMSYDDAIREAIRRAKGTMKV